MSRNPEWWIKGYQFLERINPKRYSLEIDSFLEGMFHHYKLIDKTTDTYLGPEIVCNEVKRTWCFGAMKPQPKEKV